MTTEGPPSNPVAPTIFFPVNTGPQRGEQEKYLSPDVWLSLAQAAKTLLAVAEAFLGQRDFAHQNPPLSLPRALTLRELYHEFTASKKRAKRSARYLRQLRVSLKSFAKGRWQTPIDQIKLQDVSVWVFGQDWQPKTQFNYLGDVRTFFRFAVQRGYIAVNPAAGIDLPPCDAAPPKIHTPAQVRLVLDAARNFDLDVCRMLAVRYFAGLRTAEMHRLREENILLEQGFIEVPAGKSKTRSRRLVPITPALRAWLALGGTLRAIRPDTIRAAIKASGVDWPHNVTRHSFCSYHLAMWGDAKKTALEAGHSEDILFRHYRALVTDQEAKKFWGIVPECRSG